MIIYEFICRWTDSKGVRQVVKRSGKPGENLCKIELPKSRDVLTNVYGTLFKAYTPRTATASQSHPPTVEANNIKPAAKLVIVGSAAVDISAKAAPVTPGGSDALGMQSTSPGEVAMTLGGVGRNIAEAAHRRLISYSEKLNETASALLVSPIGDDSFGRVISDHMDGMGMRTDGLVVRAEGARSAVCNMVLDSGGNLIGGVADMDIIQSLKGDQVGM